MCRRGYSTMRSLQSLSGERVGVVSVQKRILDNEEFTVTVR